MKQLPKKVVADAAYGSEENYDYLQKHELENYVKYPTFYQDTHHYRNPEIIRKHQFRSDQFEHDPESDQFICPAIKRLSYLYTSKYKTAMTMKVSAGIMNAANAKTVHSKCNVPKPRVTDGYRSVFA